MAGTLQLLFSQTLLPQEAKSAEQKLRALEEEREFLPGLVEVVRDMAASSGCRTAAAIFLKNTIRKQWQTDSPPFVDRKKDLRDEIIRLAFQTETAVRPHIVEAAAIVAQHDFPSEWPELAKILADCVAQEDTRNTALGIAERVFDRYRHEGRSDDLYAEINIVMKLFAPALLGVFKSAVETAATRSTETIRLAGDVFYSLSAQDLPEYFEDHLGEFMGLFLNVLQSADDTPEDENTPLPAQKMKTAVVNIATLYATKYSEEFLGIAEFVYLSVRMLLAAPPENNADGLFIALSRLLLQTLKTSTAAELFTGEVLQTICERVILPNIQLTTPTLELFEDEPLEFVRTDIEGTQLETRRHVSGELLKTVLATHKTLLYQPLEKILANLLEEYKAAPIANWRLKDTAIYLLVCVSSKGEISRHGATDTTDFVDIPTFFEQNIVGDLLPSNDACHPLIKVDAIRFVVSFRRILSKDQLLCTLNLLLHHLQSGNAAVSTYAAFAVEKLFSLKKAGGFVFEREETEAIVGGIFRALLKAITHKRRIEKTCENEFYPRALVRISLFSGGAHLSPSTLSELALVSSQLVNAPSFPVFSYHLFETISAFLHSCVSAKDSLAMFESAFFPVLQSILQNDVAELSPFVFQILAFILEKAPAGHCFSEMHCQILPVLFTHGLWTDPVTVPFLARLLCAYMRAMKPAFLDSGYVQQTLSVFKTLLGARSTEHISFSVLNVFVSEMPQKTVEESLCAILVAVLTKLQQNRTRRTGAEFALFVCVFLTANNIEDPVSVLVGALESLQENLFQSVLNTFVLREARSIAGAGERKIAYSALLKLAMSRAMQTETRLQLLQTAAGIGTGSPAREKDEAEEDTSTFVLGVLSRRQRYNTGLTENTAALAVVFNTLKEELPEKTQRFVEQSFTDAEKTVLQNALNTPPQ
ncbi:MAG: importin-alpha export receptor [Amphiamblys sp. WSBS2006]|nr:MAG: importin-alpha export receptor [Amphiamblys sp. WSBS2006]